MPTGTTTPERFSHIAGEFQEAFHSKGSLVSVAALVFQPRQDGSVEAWGCIAEQMLGSRRVEACENLAQLIHSGQRTKAAFERAVRKSGRFKLAISPSAGHPVSHHREEGESR